MVKVFPFLINIEVILLVNQYVLAR